MKLTIISRLTAVLVLVLATVLTAAPVPASATGLHGVLFHSDRDGDNEIYLANATTGQLLQKFTNNNAQDETPSWHPQGTHFTYTRYNDTTPSQVAIMNVSNRNIRMLTNNLQLSYNTPVFSPDGQWIATVTSDEEGQSCLRRIRVSTGVETIMRCAPEGVGLELPAWSPDGQRMMITVFDESGINRYVIKLSTGAFQQILPGAYTGVWSPDGSKIAFSSLRGPGIDVEQVSLANGDGSNPQAITSDPVRSRRAVAWYPGGNRILTISYAEPDFQVGLRSINTSGGAELVFPSVGESNDFATTNAVR